MGYSFMLLAQIDGAFVVSQTGHRNSLSKDPEAGRAGHSRENKWAAEDLGCIKERLVGDQHVKVPMAWTL